MQGWWELCRSGRQAGSVAQEIIPGGRGLGRRAELTPERTVVRVIKGL